MRASITAQISSLHRTELPVDCRRCHSSAPVLDRCRLTGIGATRDYRTSAALRHQIDRLTESTANCGPVEQPGPVVGSEGWRCGGRMLASLTRAQCIYDDGDTPNTAGALQRYYGDSGRPDAMQAAACVGVL